MAISWSINPLLRTTLPTEALVQIADINFFRNVFLTFIIISVTYPLVHQLLKHFNNYNQLVSTSKQVVVLHHAVETIVLTIATPIYTYYMIKTTFIQEEEDGMAAMLLMKSDFASVLVLCFCFITMYICELASRFANPRPLLVVHHLLTIFDGFLGFYFPTAVMLKTCSTLVYFICFEALTFAGLFMYRMAPLNKHTPKVILSGMVVFAITRPIQVIWVAAAAFGSWGDPHHKKWQAILQMSFTCLFTILQLWSININYCVWKRCVYNIERHEENRDANMDPCDSGPIGKQQSTKPRKSKNVNHESVMQEDDEEDFENEAFEASLRWLSTPSPDNPAEKVGGVSPC